MGGKKTLTEVVPAREPVGGDRAGGCGRQEHAVALTSGYYADMAEPIDGTLDLAVPSFVDELVGQYDADGGDSAAIMRLAIRLAEKNTEQGGGPFGAVVFLDGVPVAGGVNRVVSCGLSIAHAEIVALIRAQRRLRCQNGCLPPEAVLVTSTEPCCQCFGAIVWSGVTELVCGATTLDAEAIGFDEGPKPDRWAAVLEARGIRVMQGVCRAEANAVLQKYAAEGHPIYGPHTVAARP